MLIEHLQAHFNLTEEQLWTTWMKTRECPYDERLQSLEEAPWKSSSSSGSETTKREELTERVVHSHFGHNLEVDTTSLKEVKTEEIHRFNDVTAQWQRQLGSFIAKEVTCKED